jgi:methionine sulfoxide reductase catalytic subunit
MKSDTFNSNPIKPSEITTEHLYMNRRTFLKTMGIVSGSAILAACGLSQPAGAPTQSVTSTSENGEAGATSAPLGNPTLNPKAVSDELGSLLTPYNSITNYNNYYEFSLDKEAVANLAKGFKSSPWELQVYGLVHNPKTYGMEDLIKKFTQEERIYRMRCVEAWSMVIPWGGFELASLLKEVEPMSSAKYVRFETIQDPQQMPGLKSPFYPWPYNEGLRLDEAMHPLTILATELYGKPLPAQDGAPIRLVVPWKYGFKSIKSVVKIELSDKQPETMWNTIAPDEYGFYANVNPDVDHPRWSQKSERRIGETVRRKTLPFNGYAEEVASLYTGMDLRLNY